jgi:hypothetical protein
MTRKRILAVSAVLAVVIAVATVVVVVHRSHHATAVPQLRIVSTRVGAVLVAAPAGWRRPLVTPSDRSQDVVMIALDPHHGVLVAREAAGVRSPFAAAIHAYIDTLSLLYPGERITENHALTIPAARQAWLLEATFRRGATPVFEADIFERSRTGAALHVAVQTSPDPLSGKAVAALIRGTRFS